MVTIRLTRRGSRNNPYYHVVVTDHRLRQAGVVDVAAGATEEVAVKYEDPDAR